jgi:hypothetical protein
MTPPADIVRVALTALLVGMALPLMVQLFFTLRAVARASASLSRQLDENGRQLSTLMAEVRAHQRPDAGALLASALIPAAVAAIQAFRAEPTRAPAGSSPETEASS